MNRQLAIGVLLAVTVATSGCVQLATGGPVTFEASPATVDEAALQDAGYEAQDRDTFVVNRTVDVPVLGERRVEITNHVATYAGSVEENATAENASAGALIVLSTPQAKVAGQGTNPLGRAPLKELVSRLASRAGGEQSDVTHVGSESVTMLGTATTVEIFESTTQRDGRTVTTHVYVTRVAHGDDYVVAVGVVPEEFVDREEATILSLMGSVEHEGGD